MTSVYYELDLAMLDYEMNAVENRLAHLRFDLSIINFEF
jgi:hypothetical protein